MKSKKILKWTLTLPRSVFVNPQAGRILHERLLSLEESDVVSVSDNKWKGVILVSEPMRIVLRVPNMHDLKRPTNGSTSWGGRSTPQEVLRIVDVFSFINS